MAKASSYAAVKTLCTPAQATALRLLRAVAVAQEPRPDAPPGPVLGHFLEEVGVRVEEEAQARREPVGGEPAADELLHVGAPGRKRVRHLLGGRGSRVAVVRGDADGVHAGQPLHRVLDQVAGEPHRLLDGEEPRAARAELLQEVVLHRAADPLVRNAPLARRQLVHGEEDGGGGVDGHRGRDPLQRDALEQLLHVGERPDRNAHLADLAFRLRIVGVEAELGGEVEGQREPRLALLEQVAEALVRLAGRAEPRVLAHRPKLAQVHAAVDAARVGELPGRGRGLADVAGSVDGLDVDSAAGLHGRYAFFRITSSRVISSTTSPRWFLPRRRNFTRPAWPGWRPGAPQ